MRLTVKDTGHGMDHIVMEKIFDPYFTTKSPDKGTGLGLSVAYGIVKSYGGQINVRSEPGKGTTFHVDLPCIETGVEARESVYSTEPIPKGKEHILLADGEEQIARLNREMLEGLGYQVTVRTSSVEAIEAFRRQPDKFDLVITDQAMPNMTGITLSKKMLKIRSDIPIILLTGFSEAITVENARDAGLRGIIMKPVIKREMTMTIRKVLDQRIEN